MDTQDTRQTVGSKYTLEKTEGTIKNGQSRDIGHTTHRTKTNITIKHNTESQKDEQHKPYQTPGRGRVVNSGGREG